MKDQVLHIVDGKKDYYFDRRDLNDLVFVKADANYIDVCFLKTQYKSVRIQIGQLCTKLKELGAPDELIRIDRSTIINLRKVLFVDPKKKTVTLKTDKGPIPIKIAKDACRGLKEKVAEIQSKPSDDILIISRKEQNELPTPDTKDVEHTYVDLGLPSGTLWAAKDIEEMGIFGIQLHSSPFAERQNNYPKEEVDNIFKDEDDATTVHGEENRRKPINDGYEELLRGSSVVWSINKNRNNFESLFQNEEDAATVLWGDNWRIPTKEEWEELIQECSFEWRINEDGYIVCVVTGKNKNQIVLSSVSNQRGICTYWTFTEDKNKDDLFYSHNLMLEILEPYQGEEQTHHFISSFDNMECNIHPVYSAKK